MQPQLNPHTKVLLVVQTVADWGGLQDWAVGMVRGMTRLGAQVTLVANNSRIIDECREVAVASVLIDWARWRESVGVIIATCDFDVVFTQPFASRELALEIRRLTGVPVVYMSHGNNSDFAYTWKDEISKFLVASSSLVPMLRDFCGVTETPIEVLPNGFPDHLATVDPLSYEDRVRDGNFDFVLAARLMPDKLAQVDGLILIATALLNAQAIPSATVHLMGGGPSRDEFLSRLARFAEDSGNVTIQYHGWVSQETVLDYLRRAIFSVAGGVTGAQSMALGTPCLGAGIRGICGVSTPNNIDRVLGSNFGDHSARLNMSPEDIVRDCLWIIQPEHFAEFQNFYVPMMRRERTHSAIAELALRQINDAIASQ